MKKEENNSGMMQVGFPQPVYMEANKRKVAIEVVGSFLYIYAETKGTEAHYKLYFEIKVPGKADMMIYFPVKCPLNMDFEENIEEVGANLLKMSEMTFDTFNETAKLKGIKIPRLGATEDSVLFIIEDFLENAPVHLERYNVFLSAKGTFLTLDTSTGSQIITKITMLIMDQLLLNASIFDVDNNRQELTKNAKIYFSEYLELREMFHKKEGKKIELGIFNSVLFITLIDCASKVVAGPLYHKMSPTFSSLHLTRQNIDTYLQETASYMKQLNDLMNPVFKKMGKTSPYFDDWDKVFK